jgi:hypothetical protein
VVGRQSATARESVDEDAVSIVEAARIEVRLDASRNSTIGRFDLTRGAPAGRLSNLTIGLSRGSATAARCLLATRTGFIALDR